MCVYSYRMHVMLHFFYFVLFCVYLWGARQARISWITITLAKMVSKVAGEEFGNYKFFYKYPIICKCFVIRKCGKNLVVFKLDLWKYKIIFLFLITNTLRVLWYLWFLVIFSKNIFRVGLIKFGLTSMT